VEPASSQTKGLEGFAFASVRLISMANSAATAAAKKAQKYDRQLRYVCDI
jgi:hypothetical protein